MGLEAITPLIQCLINID
jgi:hypothetical protein